MVLTGAALCSGLVALRRYPCVGFGILWFLVHTLAVYAVAARTDVINERHLYLGGWGLFLLFGMLLGRLSAVRPVQSKLLLVSACCIALRLASTTLARNRAYKTELALWQDTIKKVTRQSAGTQQPGICVLPRGRPRKSKGALCNGITAQPGIGRFAQ
ncbi:MAG TPA: hypothetical protein VMT71_14085 [Syntrophorhabdales bacterium]|nr:hypothetical protein [Syntrophorhabdales bacterium]